MGVGFPATLRLHEFGHKIYQAFGRWPYHVGSSVMLKTGWRDVDVRLMLEDELYESMGLGNPKRPQNNAKWCALCQAFSSWGREITGLPIDFQIQQLSLANKEEGENVRSFLGLIPEKIDEEAAARIDATPGKYQILADMHEAGCPYANGSSQGNVHGPVSEHSS